jgi:hypothetical protein
LVNINLLVGAMVEPVDGLLGNTKHRGQKNTGTPPGNEEIKPTLDLLPFTVQRKRNVDIPAEIIIILLETWIRDCLCDQIESVRV